jgi:parallel beta-helix repeat protein
MWLKPLRWSILVIALLLVLWAYAGNELQSHEPIYISGNGGFTPESGVVSGSGTEEDPYIIEGWEIDATSSPYGIYVEQTDAYFIIRNSKIYGALVQAIRLANVKNGTIEDCEFTDNAVSIWLADSTANKVVKNKLQENFAGIYIFSSPNNEISENTIESTATTGILVRESTDNLFHHNNLIENQRNAFDDRSNQWDDGSAGNYWSDYSGEDADGDGIGDTPYEISGGENRDRYPLMEPFTETAKE